MVVRALDGRSFAEEKEGSSHALGSKRERGLRACGGAIAWTCVDIVAGYTCMSRNHLQPVGHDHESMASTAQVTPNPVGEKVRWE